MAASKFKRKYSNNKWAHRRLKFTPNFSDPQRGDDVKALQKAINARLKFIGGRRDVKVDGQFGRATLATGRYVARALGIGLNGDGISAYVQHLIRHPELRTPIQKARGKKWRKDNVTPPISVTGNKITGGKSIRQRIVAAAMQAAHLYYDGVSHRFYSQPGQWTVDHGITGEMPNRDRSDCSQFYTAMNFSAGAPDPNGNDYKGGFTGTLEAHLQEISREDLRPGEPVIYGPRGATHHVEEWVGNGDGVTTYKQLAAQNHPDRDRTVGHGSPPVDYGDIDMIAGARFFRLANVD